MIVSVPQGTSGPIFSAKSTSSRRRERAYSFAEVLVAAAILGMAIGAGVKLIANLMIQEETAYHQAVALNFQDNAARLWQLGLSPDEVANVLPSTVNNNDLSSCIVPSNGIAVPFGSSSNITLANNMGTLKNISNSVTMSFINGNTRVNTVQIYRPTIR